MNGIPKVTVAPERVTVRPGETTTVEVVIQNTSRAVEHYTTSVVGLPRDDLYACDPPTVKLRPGESGTVSVSLSMPERPAPDAGLYTLGVLVQAPYQRRVSRCEELRLDVQPAPGISVESQPEVATGGGTATYALRLANDGNTGLDISLAGTDPQGQVRFYFRPRSVRVAPNATAPAQLTVQAAAPWTGQEQRRTLTIRATAGTDLSAEKTVTFVQRPRIPGGPLRFVGIALAVGVLATATLAGALMRNAADAKPGGGAAQGQQPPPAGPPVVVPGGPGPTTPAAPASSAPGNGNASAPAPFPPGAAMVIDFSQPPDGRPPGNRPVSGDLWTNFKVKITVNLEHAPPACPDVGLALRTLPDLGAFLSTARESRTDACNQLPIRVAFAAPARRVQLSYISYKGGGYQMLLRQRDGQLKAVQKTPPKQVVDTMDVTGEADPNTWITQIEFGHLSTDPNATDPTFIKGLIFIPS
jgi:hypothetical protein